MGKEGTHVLELPYYCTITVHSLMCLQLKNFIDRISRIYSDIESFRPRCSTGLRSLCSLRTAVEKAILLIQHCSDCSKLYLALTADKILLRCEKIRKALDLYLSQIQNIVPTLLAAKISGIVEDLRGANFTIESSEAEAGKAVKELIKQDMPASVSVSESELKALRFAAIRLKITSPLAVLLEKRSIKKLHSELPETDPKRKILQYLMYLLRKYGGEIRQLRPEADLASHEEKDETRTENSDKPEPPLEFKCPISKRLMYDPVIIGSGKTFERIWIEKWFREGNDTCPVTNMRLENQYLTPNVMVKDLISDWCSNNGMTISEPCAQSNPAPVFLQKYLSFRSIASIGSSMNDLHLQGSNVSLQSSDASFGSHPLDYCKNASFGVGLSQTNAGVCISQSTARDNSINLISVPKLRSLSWESQRKAVQDIQVQLNKNEDACDWLFNNSSVKPLIQFLMDACALKDVKSQNDSAEILLSILSKSRVELPWFDKDAIYMLATSLDSETSGKALAIMESLSSQPYYKSRILASGVLPAILKVLDSHIKELRELSMKIICNLSYNSNLAYHLAYLNCVSKLVPFLGDQNLSGRCLSIMNTLCGIKEGMIAITETEKCLASIAKLVETGTEQEQETAMEILLTLCYEDAEHCQQVVGDRIGKHLFSVSENGNSRKKVIATELLQLMGYTTEGEVSESSGLIMDISSDSGNQPRGKKSTSKGFVYFGKKISRFFVGIW